MKEKKKTVRAKYGVDNVAQLDSIKQKISKSNSSEEVSLRRKATCLEKWGVDNPSKSEIVKQKQRDTFVKNYGVDNPMKNSNIAKLISDILSDPDHVETHRQHLFEKYGVTCTNNIPGVKDKMIQTTLKNHGVPYYVLSEEYQHLRVSNVISNINKRVGQMLEDEGLLVEYELVLGRKSYDIHIEDTNTLLEIDLTYTHNAIGNHWDKKGMDKNYHLEKTKIATENGYRCIHVFDWDDLDKVIRLIQPKETVYARKCSVTEIDASLAYVFEDRFHLQKSCRHQKVCLGLYYNDELIEVMTFGPPRYNKHYQWELIRLCTDSRYKVVGVAEKLFKYFIKKYNPDIIISYCDVSKFSGEVYTRLGFILHHTTEPNKVWSKGSDKVTNNLLLLRGYDQLFGTDYDKGTSNEELMIQHDWLPVYDYGQNVYK